MQQGRAAGAAAVLVVDRHPVLRDVVRLACEASDRLRFAGEARDGPSGLEAALELSPDVVVLELDLPGLTGLEVARRVRASSPQIRILVHSAGHTPEAVFASVRAGVDGFLEKTSAVDRLTDALERIAAGERLFTPEQERSVTEQLGRMVRSARETSEVASKLTMREKQVLFLIGEGLSTKQVATRLNLSPRTVETHIEKLYEKLGVRSRVQALSRAVDLGLIDLGLRADKSSPDRIGATTRRWPVWVLVCNSHLPYS